MSRTRNRVVAAVFLVALAALTLAHSLVERTAAAQARERRPGAGFEVDPFWPKPLPNHWLLGMSLGVSVDTQDQSGSSIALRPRSTTPKGRGAQRIAECCTGAPRCWQFNRPATFSLVG